MHYFMLAGAWPKHMQLGPSTLSNCQQTMEVINENKKKGNKGYRPHYLKSVVTRKQSVSVEYSNKQSNTLISGVQSHTYIPNHLPACGVTVQDPSLRVK